MAWQSFLAPYLEKDPDRRPPLRHFAPGPLQATADGEETVAENADSQSNTLPTPSKNSQSRPKRIGLWVGLGVAMAAVAALLLFVIPQQTSIPAEPVTVTPPTDTVADSLALAHDDLPATEEMKTEQQEEEKEKVEKAGKHEEKKEAKKEEKKEEKTSVQFRRCDSGIRGT